MNIRASITLFAVALLTVQSALAPAAPSPASASIAEIEEATLANRRDERVAELRQRVWNTPLGILTRDFLFSTESPTRVSQRAHQISSRVYASVRYKGARMAALQIMYRDLRENGVLTDAIERRKNQLQDELAMTNHVTNTRSATQAKDLIPLFVLIGLLGGSPVVRQQTRAVLERVFIRAGLESGPPERTLRRLDPGFFRGLRREFGAGYSVPKAIAIGGGSWFSAASVDFFMHGGTGDESSIEEQFLNYLLQAEANLEDL